MTTTAPHFRLTDADHKCMHPDLFFNALGKVSACITMMRSGLPVTLQLSVDALDPYGALWICDGDTAWTTGRNDPWDGWLHVVRSLDGLHYDQASIAWEAWAKLNKTIGFLRNDPWVEPRN